MVSGKIQDWKVYHSLFIQLQYRHKGITTLDCIRSIHLGIRVRIGPQCPLLVVKGAILRQSIIPV